MAKILDIIIAPNDILRDKSQIIDIKSLQKPEMRSFLADLALTMKEKDGIGLAAPQVGRNLRVFTVNTQDGPVFAINPRFIRKSWFREWGEEGCLSIPDTFGEVRRHKSVLCEFYDELGNKKTIKAEGLMARVFQHEYDHLDGVLYTDKARNIRTK